MEKSCEFDTFWRPFEISLKFVWKVVKNTFNLLFDYFSFSYILCFFKFSVVSKMKFDYRFQIIWKCLWVSLICNKIITALRRCQFAGNIFLYLGDQFIRSHYKLAVHLKESGYNRLSLGIGTSVNQRFIYKALVCRWRTYKRKRSARCFTYKAPKDGGSLIKVVISLRSVYNGYFCKATHL